LKGGKISVRSTSTIGTTSAATASTKKRTDSAVTFTTAAGNQGDFNTKANLTDITDPLNTVSLGGGLDLSVQAFESTVSSNPHKIGVTLRSNTGELMFSNNWVASKTEMLALKGGKISVRSTSTIGTTSAATASTKKRTDSAVT
ncbi:hypothetical protein, partial [Hymenobacter glacialis]|uniref:hypothetical protein n=1 Tax=Hymenobacter glacialis TaxID=1908236 RepID=UPI001300DACB